MVSNSNPSTPTAGTLNLVVSTWHVAHLVDGRKPEGLPTDLLENGALFLVFDKVICDKDGLLGELKWHDYWLSAWVYRELAEEGLITAQDLAPQLPDKTAFWDAVRRSEDGKLVADLADQAAAGRERDPLATHLAHMNRDLFLYIAGQLDHTLPFPYRSGILKSSYAKKRSVAPIWAPDLPAFETQYHRMTALLTLISEFLPDLPLLPKITNPEAKQALQRNSRREREALEKVILGSPTMTHENFQDFRRSKRFAADDDIVDSIPRWDETWRNFDRILAIRKQTTDLRHELQNTIRRIIDGGMDISEAYATLSSQLTAFEEYGPPPASFKRALAGGLGVNLLLGLLDFYSSALIPAEFRDLPLVAPSIVVSTALSGGFWLKDRRARDHYKRSRFPMAAFDRGFKVRIPANVDQ